MLRMSVTLLAMTIMTACAYMQDVYRQHPDYGSGADPYEKIQFAGQTATASERARCETAGGSVMPGGRLGWERCLQTFPDAGKTCSDGAECLGDCRLELLKDMPQAGETATGTCQANDSPFGCHASVENGKATPALCVD